MSTTITGLPNATTPLSGTERVPMDQAGATADASTQDIANLAPGTDLTYTASTRLLASSTGSDATLPLAGADAGLMSATDKIKLDGIASGATANSSDATLLNRANHTGTQAAGTITGLATIATSGSYADLSNKPTLGTSAALDVAASGDATSGQVVKGSDTRLSDARTPTAHTQAASSISDSTTAGRALLTAADAAAQRTALGLGSLATQSGTFSGTSSGTNTGDQTITLTGDVTGSGTGSFAATLASTAVTAGSYGSGSQVGSFTVDAKGRLTAASNVNISIAATGISDSTAAGRALLTGADAAAQRTSLGLGTAATSASTAFAVSGAVGSSGLTMTTARLLGRSTAGTGGIEEIQVTGATLSGGVLTITSGGTPGGTSGQLQWNSSGAFAGASTLTYDGSILTSSGRFINSYNATASSPAKAFTGTWFTGGTATTTKPHVLIEPAGTTSTAWSTSGTGLGVNAPSGFAGNLLDLQVNGTSAVKVDPASGITGLFATSGSFAGISVTNTGSTGSSSTGLTATGNTTAQLYARCYGSSVTSVTVFGVTLANCAFVGTLGAASEGLLVGTVTAKPFVLGTNDTERIRITSSGLITFGGITSSFPALKRSSAILQARLADDSAYTTLDAQHRLQGTAPASATATGTAGDIRYDADYVYVCTASNTWKRAALSTW